ncbi:MAG: flagellar hook-length control protein FliK [Polyangiaceae bacterium]|nr:flagellar hook-length control protein FliK [Polyangiaceae bacterium]
MTPIAVGAVEKSSDAAALLDRPAATEVDARIGAHVDRVALRKAVEAHVNDPELGRIDLRIEHAPSGLDLQMATDQAATATLLRQNQGELHAILSSSAPVSNVSVAHVADGSAFFGASSQGGGDRAPSREAPEVQRGDDKREKAERPRATGRRIRAVL